MYFVKSFVVLAAAAALVSASPAVNGRAGGLVERQKGNNCQDTIGDCFQNGCAGTFASPSATIGTCTAGTWDGCPCEKCGAGTAHIGSCSDNGCGGVQGMCTTGTYQGCPCK